MAQHLKFELFVFLCFFFVLSTGMAPQLKFELFVFLCFFFVVFLFLPLPLVLLFGCVLCHHVRQVLLRKICLLLPQRCFSFESHRLAVHQVDLLGVKCKLYSGLFALGLRFAAGLDVIGVRAAHHASSYPLISPLWNDSVRQAWCLSTLHVRLNTPLPQLDHVWSFKTGTSDACGSTGRGKSWLDDRGLQAGVSRLLFLRLVHGRFAPSTCVIAEGASIWDW